MSEGMKRERTEQPVSSAIVPWRPLHRQLEWATG
jgi:hypothetical protein